MRRLVLVCLLTLVAFGAALAPAPTTAAPSGPVVDCSIVLCAACPDGTVWSPTPTNCCRCVPK